MIYDTMLVQVAQERMLDYQQEAKRRQMLKLLPPSQPGRFVAFFNHSRAIAPIEEGQYHGRTRRKLMAVR